MFASVVSTIKRFAERVKNNKKTQIFLIVILSIALLFFLNFGFKSENEYEKIDNVGNYVHELEEKLSRTLSQVDGAGKVSVIINVESGMQTVLADKTIITEGTNGKEIETSPIIVNGKTVVLKELYPKITGVLIVSEGASNIGVHSKLQQATMSLLDINVNQIEILKMK